MMVPQLSIRIRTSKRPLDAASFGVALALPGIGLASDGSPARQPSAEAWATQNADLDAHHTQWLVAQKRGGNRSATLLKVRNQ
ncbi:MAG: hypothetical protein ACYCXT_08700 [Acidiferrobacteraceae bacterium]